MPLREEDIKQATATPDWQLARELADPRVGKTEREHYAARRIAELESMLAHKNAIIAAVDARVAELEDATERWRGESMNADADGSLAMERALKAERERDEARNDAAEAWHRYYKRCYEDLIQRRAEDARKGGA